MGAKISKRYSSLKSLLNPSKLFLKFLLSGLHKSTVLDFSNFEFLIFQQFLALLDSVSRAYSMGLCASSVVRPSSVAWIISEVTAWIAFKFQLWLPLGHMPTLFFHF